MAILKVRKPDGSIQEIQAIVGPRGEKGDKGDTGSAAQVTAENIETALGYVPLKEEEDPTVPDWAKAESKPTYQANEIVLGDSTVGAVISEQSADIAELQTGKQDKLVAGTNITIAADGKTISASGGGSSDVTKAYVDKIKNATVAESTVTTSEEVSVEWIASKFVMVNGSSGTSSDYKCTEKFSVTEGETIYVNANSIRFICAYSGDSVAADKGTTGVTTYTVPSGVTHIVITVYTVYDMPIMCSTSAVVFTNNVLALATENQNKLALIGTYCTVKNEFDNSTVKVGWVAQNGSKTANTSYMYNIIDVSEGDSLYCWRISDGTSAAIKPRFICAYGTDDVVLPDYGDNTGASAIPYVVNAAVKKVAFTFLASYTNQIMVVKNSSTAPIEYTSTTKNLSYIQYDKINGRFFGKKFTALGDSITAQHKWYDKVQKYTNTLITNCGIGGSKVSGAGGFTHNDRINAIPSDTEVLLIMGGMNDWAQNIPLGEKKLSNVDVTTFYGAANVLIQKVTAHIPNAKIICMGCSFGMFPNREEFTDATGLYNNQGLTSVEYGRALVDIFRLNGIESFVIGEECGWNANNISTYVTNDGAYLHPNETGGAIMGDVIIRHLR